MSKLNRKSVRQRIHTRIRKKVTGSAQRPRLAVNYSNQHIYVQVIDDVAGSTITAASSMAICTWNGGIEHKMATMALRRLS